MTVTALQCLEALVRLSDPAHPVNVARREREAREALATLREQYASEYVALACELRCRGMEPTQTKAEYIERRLCERFGLNRGAP